jgi:hypothetical protein
MLKPVADDFWIVDGPEIKFSYLGLKLPFPTRMCVLRLSDGSLWLHSPTKPDETLQASLAALGPIRYLIAPNTLHYWWVPDWKRRFPEALVFAPPGLEQSAKRRLEVDWPLEADAPPLWAADIGQIAVEGGYFREWVFFHPRSRTLILTDLIENFEMSRVRSSAYRLLLRLGGVADPNGKAPYDMQLSFRRHRAAVKAAAEQMIAWNPERVIIAHGRWYAENGAGELRRAFRWAL